MAKYDPLCDHLKRQTLGELLITFAEIEALVGPLPPSAERPQWWANVRNPVGPHVQRSAWRDAGYDAFLIVGGRRVRFVRVPTDRMDVALSRAMVPKASSPPAPSQRVKPALTVQALLAGGFEQASGWVLSKEGKLALDRPLPRSPGVYVFAIRGVAVYAGIASSGLARRLAFYVRPGATQRTSQRVGAQLVDELKDVGAIEILTASPPDSSWNGWPINSAAGLEVGLIANFDVPWNLRGV